ncbi:MAG: hypothetical protein CL515_03865 [Actinobacteria bacterium]|nr:hypothetical protein [Actinomycetota bacterium]|tara:strand:+ start:44848 stop:46215 length:1368 start_codon:yes stop_codon:yes gene_type:complete
MPSATAEKSQSEIEGSVSAAKSNPEEAAGTTPNEDVGTDTSTAIDKNQASEVPEKPKTTFQSLSYPQGLDNTDEFPHQIMFNVLIRQTDDEHKANSHLGEGGKGEDLISRNPDMDNENAKKVSKQLTNAAIGGSTALAAFAKGGLPGIGIGLAGGTGLAFFGDRMSALVDDNIKLSRRNVARIRMAMPQSPQNKMTAEWSVTDFGSIMGAIMEGAGDQGIMNMIKDETMTGEAGQAMLRTAAGALNITKQAGLNIPAQATIELMTRKVTNPFKETLFKTMNFRDFPFVFKFAPKNDQELLQTLKIINVFERYMTPQKSPGAFFLEYPAEFEIVYQYKNKENRYFTNFFNDTALVSFQVDYGNGGVYTAFQGTEGAPSEITMSLQFKELTLLDRDSIVDITGQSAVMGGFTGENSVQGQEPPAEEQPDEKNADGTDKNINETDSSPDAAVNEGDDA